MAAEDYAKAKKNGRKAFKDALLHRKNPYLPALDAVLSGRECGGEERLSGIYELPLSLVIGTRTKSRAESFACNFMPILAEHSEFAIKWQALYESQLQEGIREPVRVYEYKRRFYVQEGNKRVSVLNYVGAGSISAEVLRVLPGNDGSARELLCYREYTEFVRCTGILDFLFAVPGSYRKLAEYYGSALSEPWEEEAARMLRADFQRFCAVFDKKEADQEERSDAFLIYLRIFGSELLRSGTDAEIAEQLRKAAPELSLAEKKHRVALIEEPSGTETAGMGRLRSRSLFEFLFSGGESTGKLRVAFLNSKTPERSRWTYGHMLGVSALRDKYGDELDISVYNECDDADSTGAALSRAVAEGSGIIFATAGQMQPQVLSAALEHPKLHFLNCAVNTSYKSMRTYYARLYEAKFVLGAIAAALSEQDILGYVADYPVYGTVASVNAFAIGAQLVNPRARISLSWSGVSAEDWETRFLKEGIRVISGPDLLVPGEESRAFGLYRVGENGRREHLAMPLIDWGRYYELLVASVLGGSFAQELMRADGQALNYYWGMSSGVVDVICARRVPEGTLRLSGLMKEGLRQGVISPFYGALSDQKGALRVEAGKRLESFDIVNMDWLYENVHGEIPEAAAFKADAQAFLRESGIAAGV